MEQAGRLQTFIVDERLNAVLSWCIVAFVAGVALLSFLEGDLLWAWFSGAVIAIILVPAAKHRSWRVMLPWEVLALVFLPVLGRALASFPLSTDLATYISVAALALVVAVELDVFTAVRMTNGFAALFTVIITMAAAGLWAVVQWFSDLLLGTTLIYSTPVTVPDAAVAGGRVEKAYWFSDLLVGTTFVGEEPLSVPASTEATALDALMWDFIAATVAGFAAAGVFVLYFRRLRDSSGHLPDELANEHEVKR